MNYTVSIYRTRNGGWGANIEATGFKYSIEEHEGVGTLMQVVGDILQVHQRSKTGRAVTHG